MKVKVGMFVRQESLMCSLAVQRVTWGGGGGGGRKKEKVPGILLHVSSFCFANYRDSDVKLVLELSHLTHA